MPKLILAEDPAKGAKVGVVRIIEPSSWGLNIPILCHPKVTVYADHTYCAYSIIVDASPPSAGRASQQWDSRWLSPLLNCHDPDFSEVTREDRQIGRVHFSHSQAVPSSRSTKSEPGRKGTVEDGWQGRAILSPELDMVRLLLRMRLEQN
ncbi:hypothetical protein B7463_g9260, partial [Scytalidium lignicola]